jgi:predicted transposase/invertase (TIGR01784 family)
MRVIQTSDGLEILLPKNDFLFKVLFGDVRNKALLKSFLQAVLELPDSEFDVEFLDPHKKRRFIDSKMCILDILVQTKTGKQIEIEMQVVNTSHVFERICYYKSEMVVDQLWKGEDYDKVKKVISITVADFSFIEGGDPKRYHHCFRLYDPADGTSFGDVEEVHVLELPKLPLDSDKTAVWTWLRFINVEDEEELKVIARQNEVMSTAVNELYRVSSDRAIRREYSLRERAWRDEQARTDYATQKGEAQGMIRGRKEGLEEGEIKGMAKGIDAFYSLIQQGHTPQEAKEILDRQNPPMAAG